MMKPRSQKSLVSLLALTIALAFVLSSLPLIVKAQTQAPNPTPTPGAFKKRPSRRPFNPLPPEPEPAPMKYGDKAFRPGAIWQDDKGVHLNAHGGGVLAHEGQYFFYGEHKVEGPRGNSAQVGVHVYSSRDLTNWIDEGICFKVSENPASEITRGCILERPKVIYNAKTHKFVMWFHLELRGQGYSAARVGVAVADAPAGPFTYISSFRLNPNVWPENVSAEIRQSLTGDSAEKRAALLKEDPSLDQCMKDFKKGQMSRDMGLFVDDDGKAYHIGASEENRTLHITLLSDDYLSPTQRYVRILPGRMNEAPALFKHQGRYFLITSGCTGWAPNPGRLAVADSIWGPWKEYPNPWQGAEEARVKISYDTQSTCVLPVAGKPGAFIFMSDRWRPRNAIDGRYVWLPIEWQNGLPVLKWLDEWNMSLFDQPQYKAPEMKK